MPLSSSSSSRSKYLIITVCVIVAVIACVVQNTIHPSGTTLVFDSGHYMGTVQMLCQAIQAYTAGLPFAESQKLYAYLLLDGPLVPLAGTLVFTILGKIPQTEDWCTFVYIEIFFQALATASLTSLAFNLSASKHAKFLALGTGLAWALYPPAILGTNSFLGELPVTALVLFAMCLMAKTIRLKATANSALQSNILALVSGSVIALVFMSKPALVVSLGLLVLLWLAVLLGPDSPPSNNQQADNKIQSKVIILLSVCIGATIALKPWLVFTHSTTGSWRASAHRVPIYNITRGLSCDSEGWGTVPLDPTMQGYSEDTKALDCMASIVKEKPWQSINLALRKPERLWLLPWNDFHHKCLGIGLGLQIFLHQFILVLSAIGLILMPLSLPKLKDQAARFIAVAAPLVILGHAAYIPFETCSRYGFTAMPMVFLLCTIAISTLLNYRKQAPTYRVLQIGLVLSVVATIVIARADLLSLFQSLMLPTALAALLEYAIKGTVMILVFVIARRLCRFDIFQNRPLLKISSQAIAVFLSVTVIVAFLAHYAYEREERTWKCRLEAGESISRSVKYTANSKINWHLLLVDCEAAPDKGRPGNRASNDGADPLSGSTISINGKQLTEPSFNPVSLIQTWAKLDQMQLDCASIFGKAPSTLRQWRAYYIPTGYLDSDKINTITLEAGKALTIFGDSNQTNEQAAFIPAIDYLSAAKLLYEQESPDGRIITPTFQAKQSQCLPPSKELLEQNDLSPALGRQCGSYRMYIVSGDNNFWQRNSLNTTSYAEAF
ncbi:MAG: hypothetical protein Q8T09_06755 [Candidatus Melainabacteria bacterium]|nr:hypothetical protein [Candidatus Melainabacteria bacterium]